MPEAELRGRLRRHDKAMTMEETEAFLASAFCGRTATVGPDGYPYVVPNLFTWSGGKVYLHTARYEGHFLTNMRLNDKVCFEIDEPGEVYPYGDIECDTSVSYRSVIIFGRIAIVEDVAKVEEFFRAFMTKYAPEDSWGRPKDSFPRTGGTIVYAITPESITGKQGKLPVASQRWPAKNNTASPAWTRNK